ncbi:MAG: HD domain-containing protein [Gammaproteobacteria bacterium]|nr:HD domain-containing protein [Gammaproteobacteria bacterium]
MTTLLEVLAFSSDRHRNQTRKDSDASPYINHPIEVARTLVSIGSVEDINVIAAALLHDTVEDTTTTEAELESLFGAAISSIVAEVTDDQSLRSDERKRLQIENTPTASHEAKLVKLGDKIANVTDVMRAPPSHWSTARRREYVEWAQRVIAGTRGTNGALESHFDTVAQQALSTLED